MDSDCLLEQYFFQSNGCFLQLRIHRFFVLMPNSSATCA